VPDQPQDLKPPKTEDQPHQPESPCFSRGHSREARRKRGHDLIQA
jgi:hypothetical protein